MTTEGYVVADRKHVNGCHYHGEENDEARIVQFIIRFKRGQWNPMVVVDLAYYFYCTLLVLLYFYCL